MSAEVDTGQQTYSSVQDQELQAEQPPDLHADCDSTPQYHHMQTCISVIVSAITECVYSVKKPSLDKELYCII